MKAGWRSLLVVVFCLTLLVAGCISGPSTSGSDTTDATPTVGEEHGDTTEDDETQPAATTATTASTTDQLTTETTEMTTTTPEPTATLVTAAKSAESVGTESNDPETTVIDTTEPTTGTSRSMADTTAGTSAVASATELHEGEYYRLNTTVSDAFVEFEVLSIDGGEATVEITGTTSDGNASTTTVRGDTTSVLRQVIDSKRDFGFLLLARAPTAVVEGRSLTVGEEFTVASADVTVGGQTPESGTFSVAVTGTDTVSGIECTTVEIDLDGGNRQTACVTPSLLFAPRTTLYNDAGEPTGTIFIEEYRAGGNDTNERTTRR